jgi:hypothetical protein
MRSPLASQRSRMVFVMRASFGVVAVITGQAVRF